MNLTRNVQAVVPRLLRARVRPAEHDGEEHQERPNAVLQALHLPPADPLSRPRRGARPIHRRAHRPVLPRPRPGLPTHEAGPRGRGEARPVRVPRRHSQPRANAQAAGGDGEDDQRDVEAYHKGKALVHRWQNLIISVGMNGWYLVCRFV